MELTIQTIPITPIILIIPIMLTLLTMLLILLMLITLLIQLRHKRTMRLRPRTTSTCYQNYKKMIWICYSSNTSVARFPKQIIYRSKMKCTFSICLTSLRHTSHKRELISIIHRIQIMGIHRVSSQKLLQRCNLRTAPWCPYTPLS